MATIYLLENSLDVLYTCCEQDGKIVKTNDLMKQFISHIKPSNFLDIVNEADKDDFIAAIAKARESKPNPVRAYARTRTKTGSDRFCVWNIYDMGKLYIKGYQLFDVTSVTAHEHERLKALLSDASFMVSHEVRQPLTSIMGLVDLITAQEELPQDVNELVLMLKDTAKALEHAVSDLIRKMTRQI